MRTYREHQKIIAALILVWVVMCGGALSATGKIDADLHHAGQWLLGQTLNVGIAVLPGLESELMVRGDKHRSSQSTESCVQGLLSAESANSGKSLRPELTYYL